MNQTPILIALCLAIALPLALPASAAAPVQVGIRELSGNPAAYAFDPPLVQIPAGTTVTWTNTGTLYHTVTMKISSTGEVFDAGLEPGQSFSHTFASAGVTVYHCVPHETPQNGNMRGGVIVG